MGVKINSYLCLYITLRYFILYESRVQRAGIYVNDLVKWFIVCALFLDSCGGYSVCGVNWHRVTIWLYLLSYPYPPLTHAPRWILHEYIIKCISGLCMLCPELRDWSRPCNNKIMQTVQSDILYIITYDPWFIKKSHFSQWPKNFIHYVTRNATSRIGTAT